jgi:hypothetical protein
MRLTFKAGRWLDEYHGNGLNMKPGDSVEVADNVAARLLGDFPENFFETRIPLATDIAAPPMDRQIKSPRGRKSK